MNRFYPRGHACQEKGIIKNNVSFDSLVIFIHYLRFINALQFAIDLLAPAPPKIVTSPNFHNNKKGLPELNLEGRAYFYQLMMDAGIASPGAADGGQSADQKSASVSSNEFW